MTRNLVKLGGALGIVLALAVLGWLLSRSLLEVAIGGLLFVYLGQCWNIVSGYGGHFSFGHAAFFGTGAYASAYFAQHHDAPWVGLGLGILIAAALGYVVGLAAFKFGLRGPFYALSTLAIAESMRLLAMNTQEVGGAYGLLIPLDRDLGWRGLQFSSRYTYYLVILGLVCLVFALVYALDRSRMGYFLRATREDETVAQSLGVDSRRYMIRASAISAGLTAIGGSFYAQWLLFIDPPLVFGTDISITMVVTTLLGGMGTVLGPFVGGLFLTPLSEISRELLRDRPGADLVLYGAILAAVVLFMPRGIVGLWQGRRRQVGRDRHARPPAADDVLADDVAKVTA